MLTVLRRRQRAGLRARRGVYLLPSMFTMANMFCGYACVIHAMRGDYAIAAPFIGVSIVLDMLDGRIARLTGSTSAFGVQFDSLADVISFGVAPAVLAFAWGLSSFGRLGWVAGFLYVLAAAIRLARFNVQAATQPDKRFFVGLPSPAAAAVPAATVFAYPYGLQGWYAVLAFAMVLVPAFLMVSTIRYRSFNSFGLGWRPSFRPLLLTALVFAAIATYPQVSFVIMAYSYLLSGLVGLVVARLGRRPTLRSGAEPSEAIASPPSERRHA